MRCRWRAPLDTTALVVGFRTRSMVITVTSQPPLEINWTSPLEARFIACGVFTCNPFIEDRPGTPGTDTDALGNPLPRIGNVEACLREFSVSDSSRTSTPLGRQAVFVATSSTCDPEETLTPAIDFLAAGCWAYDDYHIIAASDLKTILPEDYVKVSPSFHINEDCSAPGVDCYNPMNNFFGRCAAGACQPYCITAEDCDLAAQTVLGRPKSNTCDWDCALSPTSVVGGCVPK